MSAHPPLRNHCNAVCAATTKNKGQRLIIMEKTLSLIVPVYNEEEVLETSFSRMDAVMKKIGYPYEIIYVNDGSRDGSMKILRNIAKNNPQVKVRSFSRNFGHQLAVTCGMDAAKGDALIIIDVDLQDPPEVIEQMVKAWENGADIAYGKRLKRQGETIFKKLTAAAYYRLLKSMSATAIPLDTGEVPNLTTTIQGESARQVDIEAGNLHLLEVTFRTGTDGKRAERICILECIRQVTCKEHYILLTDAPRRCELLGEISLLSPG